MLMFLINFVQNNAWKAQKGDALKQIQRQQDYRSLKEETIRDNKSDNKKEGDGDDSITQYRLADILKCVETKDWGGSNKMDRLEWVCSRWESSIACEYLQSVTVTGTELEQHQFNQYLGNNWGVLLKILYDRVKTKNSNSNSNSNTSAKTDTKSDTMTMFKTKNKLKTAVIGLRTGDVVIRDNCHMEPPCRWHNISEPANVTQRWISSYVW